MNVSEPARRVQSLDDVIDLLDAPQVALPELLDAMRVSRHHGVWRLVEKTSARAMSLIAQRHYPERSVREIALNAVIADLKRAQDLDAVRDRSKTLNELLAHLAQGPNAAAISSVAQILNDLHVLLVEGSPPSLVSACARLRKLDRPDLGLEAVRNVLQESDTDLPAPTKASALNTGAAAALDLQLGEEAGRMA